MIVIVPYRPEWPAEFRAIAERLRDAGGDAILAIHHIGSTAVPGLAAKDIIDIQITVAALDTLRLPLPGFVRGAPVTDHCPPGLTLPPAELEKRFYKSEARPANVHVRVAGRFNQRYPLLCRDYLRTHRGAADAYGEIKRQLARLVPDDVEAYYDVKDPVFDIIMAGAEDWAASTGWTVPPGD
ncbi:MAG: GrpB family protein [Rhizomicrobium sp.]